MNQNSYFQIPNPKPQLEPPLWLWRAVRLGLAVLVVVVAGFVIVVASGVADPRPVGSLKWEEKWIVDSGQWVVFGEKVEIGEGKLEIVLERGEIGGAVTRSEGAEYTFEVAGGQADGEIGAAYGIVFGYESPESYIAAMINGNGYVEVVSADGREWMAWQQWPNILLGTEANRLRVDVQGGQGLIRINDEVLMRVPVGDGAIGVIARASADSQRVRFGWAKYWTR
ncbi:MAG: hypothetical protein AAB382_02500 [Chloroflexota bacterium]